jgi:hypothetical protein
MAQTIAGTFAFPFAVSGAAGAYQSPPLMIPRGSVNARLSTARADASNTIKTRKRTVPGGAFADQVTYNAAQVNTNVAVVEGEEWIVELVALQAGVSLDYKMTIEN